MEKGIVIIFFVLLLSGCGEPYMQVAGGNGRLRRGMYQQALAAYLQAAESTKYEKVMQYNIANVYYFLGETERALQTWQSAASASHLETAYRAFFNMGVVQYGSKDFSAAAESFLQAARMHPDRTEVKVNLEYCFRQMNTKGGTEAAENAETDTRNIETMMSIIKANEKLKWEETPTTETADSAVRDW